MHAENALMEREIAVRRKIEQDWNRTCDNFDHIDAYNDYLEEREDVIFNLINGIHVEETQAKVAEYRVAHIDEIAQNAARAAAEEKLRQETIRVEQEQLYLRRQQFARQDERERVVRLEAEKQFLEAISAGGNVDKLEKKLATRREGARDEALAWLTREEEEERLRREEEEHEKLKRKLRKAEANAKVLELKEEQSRRRRVVGSALQSNVDAYGMDILGDGRNAAKTEPVDDEDAMDEDEPEEKRVVTELDIALAGGWMERYATDKWQQEAFEGLAEQLAHCFGS